jgi:hypothetical protein
MNCTAWSEKLHDYADGALAPADAAALEAHVAGCADCRRALESLRALRTATSALDRELAPERDLWPEIRAQMEPGAPAALGAAKAFPNLSAAGTPRSTLQWFVPLAVAASVALLFAVVQRAPVMRAGPSWTVASVEGAPRVGSRAISGSGQIYVGQWLETDQASRAKVEVGSIGYVNVEPNSRLQLVNTSATNHRVELARGQMHALIWAPPRIFFVNTPSATAVDLGCAYDLRVDDRGAGTLRVTSGYVALEHNGRESIIPSGLECQTRRDKGPGTPYDPAAPAPFRRALDRFDFHSGGMAALDEILKYARGDDYVTLWHLLSRAPSAAQRGAVFDALAKDHPAPVGVSRADIVANDAASAAMREAWADALGLRSFARRPN